MARLILSDSEIKLIYEEVTEKAINYIIENELTINSINNIFYELATDIIETKLHEKYEKYEEYEVLDTREKQKHVEHYLKETLKRVFK